MKHEQNAIDQSGPELWPCLVLTTSLQFFQYLANKEVCSLISLMKNTSAVKRTSRSLKY